MCAIMCCGFLDKLLTENDIAFLKWDYNRNWSEPGWDQLARRGAEARVCGVHAESLLRFWRAAEEASESWRSRPAQAAAGAWTWEFCAMPTRLASPTIRDPFDRLSQQDGFSYAYTPQVMMAWVTDSPHWLNNGRTTFARLPDAELDAGLAGHRRRTLPTGRRRRSALAKRLIAAYHQVQPTIVRGRPVPADFAAQRQRVFGNADGEARTRARRWSLRSSIQRRRGASSRHSS